MPTPASTAPAEKSIHRRSLLASTKRRYPGELIQIQFWDIRAADCYLPGDKCMLLRCCSIRGMRGMMMICVLVWFGLVCVGAAQSWLATSQLLDLLLLLW